MINDPVRFYSERRLTMFVSTLCLCLSVVSVLLSLEVRQHRFAK